MADLLKFQEALMNITMMYGGLYGNKGYDTQTASFIHAVYAHTATTQYELYTEDAKGGAIPISTPMGLKIPAVVLDGYFPYRFPDDFFDVFMPTLAPFRKVNSCKNVFLTSTVLTVLSNGANTFAELPIGSKWYVHSYEWKREMKHKDRGGFNLVLWRWYK